MKKIVPSYTYKFFIETLENEIKDCHKEIEELKKDFFKNPSEEKIFKLRELRHCIITNKSEIAVIKHWKFYKKFIQELLS